MCSVCKWTRTRVFLSGEIMLIHLHKCFYYVELCGSNSCLLKHCCVGLFLRAVRCEPFAYSFSSFKPRQNCPFIFLAYWRGLFVRRFCCRNQRLRLTLRWLCNLSLLRIPSKDGGSKQYGSAWSNPIESLNWKALLCSSCEHLKLLVGAIPFLLAW